MFSTRKQSTKLKKNPRRGSSAVNPIASEQKPSSASIQSSDISTTPPSLALPDESSPAIEAAKAVPTVDNETPQSDQSAGPVAPTANMRPISSKSLLGDKDDQEGSSRGDEEAQTVGRPMTSDEAPAGTTQDADDAGEGKSQADDSSRRPSMSGSKSSSDKPETPKKTASLASNDEVSEESKTVPSTESNNYGRPTGDVSGNQAGSPTPQNTVPPRYSFSTSSPPPPYQAQWNSGTRSLTGRSRADNSSDEDSMELRNVMTARPSVREPGDGQSPPPAEAGPSKNKVHPSSTEPGRSVSFTPNTFSAIPFLLILHSL